MEKETNIFGAECQVSKTYHLQMYQHMTAYDNGDIQKADCLKLCWLAICEYHSNIQDCMNAYTQLKSDMDIEVDYRMLNAQASFKADGCKIKCIKEDRNFAGVGLKEAKLWVEANELEICGGLTWAEVREKKSDGDWRN